MHQHDLTSCYSSRSSPFCRLKWMKFFVGLHPSPSKHDLYCSLFSLLLFSCPFVCVCWFVIGLVHYRAGRPNGTNNFFPSKIETCSHVRRRIVQRRDPPTKDWLNSWIRLPCRPSDPMDITCSVTVRILRMQPTKNGHTRT